ncbi:MAG TPA: hypothetical protein VK801_17480 [Caulobacteraceae bacterium]|nr:hypothetical protein [Caulobacteraceae bacterium]
MARQRMRRLSLLAALGLLATAIGWVGAPTPGMAQPSAPGAVAAPAASAPTGALTAERRPDGPPGRHHPGPPPSPTPLADKTVITVAILLATVLGAFTAVGPIVFYMFDGWGWRRHVIVCSLSDQAKDKYLSTYHSELSDPATASRRFAAFYDHWFGRGRLIVPTVLITIIVTLYTFLLTCYAAQSIAHWSIVYLADDPSGRTAHALAIAAASIAGAYVFVSLEAIGQVARRDVTAEDLCFHALRYMGCVPVAFALSSLVKNDAALIIAFAAGAFPLSMIARVIRQDAQKRLGVTPTSDTQADLITKLLGVDGAVFARMNEIGVTSIGQMAWSDPIALTMRTNFGFMFVLDLVSQALAWSYLGTKLETLRPMGLRGAYEIRVLMNEANDPASPLNANALDLIPQAAAAVGLTLPEFLNAAHQVADDATAEFLVEATQ